MWVENSFQCTHSWHHHISGHFLWMLPLRRCSITPHWCFPPLQYTMLWWACSWLTSCVAFRLKKLWTLQVETEVAFSSQWTCRVLSVSGFNRASKEQSKKKWQWSWKLYRHDTNCTTNGNILRIFLFQCVVTKTSLLFCTLYWQSITGIVCMFRTVAFFVIIHIIPWWSRLFILELCVV